MGYYEENEVCSSQNQYSNYRYKPEVLVSIVKPATQQRNKGPPTINTTLLLTFTPVVNLVARIVL